MSRQHPHIRLFPLIGFILIFTSHLTALGYSSLEQPDTVSLFNFLYDLDEDIPVLKINTKVNKLINKKLKEEEQEAKLLMNGQDGEDLIFDIKVRARGNIRKQVCYYPPLMLNLKKSQLNQSGFSKLDQLKLVLQCRDSKSGAYYIDKEFLVYQLYNLIDSNCVRAKLIEVELWDGEDLKKTLDGFIVEEEDHFANRLNGKIIETGNVRSPSIQRDHYLKMVFFQYMIANTDWTIPNKHNVEIVKVPEYPRVIAVPYDFDYAGIVGTSYAIPHTSIPIANVKQRYFMGFQVSEEEAKEMVAYFMSRKEDILNVCAAAYYLDEKTKKEVSNFIGEFFEILESEKKVRRNFVTKDK